MISTFTYGRRVATEAVGTALLLAGVVGSGIMGERLAGGNVAIALLANSLATGAVLVALIIAFGPISGAHLNPVVTLLQSVRRVLPPREAGAYVLAQVGGAFVGVALAHGMFGVPISASTHAREGWSQGLSEFVATFGLVVVVWGTSRIGTTAASLAVAGYITGAYWFTSSTCFANPAVTLARSMTVRINGQDIQLESRESVCGDCGKLCKDNAVTCREWRYRDQWFTSPPRGLFVDAILSAMHVASSVTPQREPAKAMTPFEVPGNLKRFFATKAASTSRPGCCSAGGDDGADAGCCASGATAKTKDGCCESEGSPRSPAATEAASTSRPGCCSAGSDNNADEGCCASRTTAKSKDGCCESEGSPNSPAATEAACTLGAESRAARKGVLKELMSGVVERRNLENGIAFRFKAEPGLLTRLASLIELERTCCVFLTFGIRVEEKGGPVWLELTGPPSAKKLIDEYFAQK